MTYDELDDYAEKMQRNTNERRALIEERNKWKAKAEFWKHEAIKATAKLGEIRILMATNREINEKECGNAKTQ